MKQLRILTHKTMCLKIIISVFFPDLRLPLYIKRMYLKWNKWQLISLSHKHGIYSTNITASDWDMANKNCTQPLYNWQEFVLLQIT